MKLARDEINEAAADWPFDPIVTPMHTSIGTLQFGAQVVNFRMPARFGWCPTTKASDTSRSSGALVANFQTVTRRHLLDFGDELPLLFGARW